MCNNDPPMTNRVGTEDSLLSCYLLTSNHFLVAHVDDCFLKGVSRIGPKSRLTQPLLAGSDDVSWVVSLQRQRARRVPVSPCLSPFQLFHPLSPAWCVRPVGSFGSLISWLEMSALAWRLIPRATVEGLERRTNPPPSISRPPSTLSKWARTRVIAFPILGSLAPSPCRPWHTVEAPGRLQGWQCRRGPIMTSSRVGAAETNVSIAVAASRFPSSSRLTVPVGPGKRDTTGTYAVRKAAFFFFFSWPCLFCHTNPSFGPGPLCLGACLWLAGGGVLVSVSAAVSSIPHASMPCILATDQVP